MKKYNTRKRAIYKQQLHAHEMHDAHEAYDLYKYIHISIRYDGYKHTEYIAEYYRQTHRRNARMYINMMNAINDIFPDIYAPHNAHIYNANAPYRQCIPSPDTGVRITAPRTHTRQRRRTETRQRIAQDTHIKDKRKVKCIIFSHDKPIYACKIIRTIEIHNGEIRTYLHKKSARIRVYPYIVQGTCKGYTDEQIRAHDVEIYSLQK